MRFLIALQKGKIAFFCFQTKKLQFSVSSRGTGIPQPLFFPHKEKRRNRPSFPPSFLSSLLNKNFIEKTPLLASQGNRNGDKYFFLKSQKFAHRPWIQWNIKAILSFWDGIWHVLVLHHFLANPVDVRRGKKNRFSLLGVLLMLGENKRKIKRKEMNLCCNFPASSVSAGRRTGSR